MTRSRGGGGLPIQGSYEEHFWRRVDRGRPEDCWEWQGSRIAAGYGRAWAGSHLPGPKIWQAHRIAYYLTHGNISIGKGMTIDHLCRNRICVNPAHLEEVPIGENTLRGENTPAWNSRKTQCKHGHPFTPENTYRPLQGGRKCRTCLRRQWARTTERRRQQRLSASCMGCES